VEYDAIVINLIDFDAPSKIENAIVTSKNAAHAILNKNIQITKCFCVGDKTQALLEENGLKVAKKAKNASYLGDFIQKKHQNESFYFFCGNLRMPEIPTSFKNSKNTLFEVKTYETELNFKKFDQNWDGILFFSPSGVQSYFHLNKTDAPVFCIGNTTAQEAQKFTNNIVIANTTSIESVIAKAIKTLG